jgi:hypothetical protein
MTDRDDRWGEPEPLYTGDALGDLHGGKGTRWVKDPVRGYWPDCCDSHRPESKRVGKPAKPARAKPAPADDATPIDEQTALKLLITWLRKIPKERR